MVTLCVTSAAAEERLKLATTTSLYDSKLLYSIEDRFEEKFGVDLDIVSGGTGIAIEYGERGDVDVLMVHDKARELKFVEDGYGVERRCIAYNYFNIVGPEEDPAGIKGMSTPEALKSIMEQGLTNPQKVKFVTRGDASGTHAKEQRLWKAAGYDYAQVNTSGPWYIMAGQGMGATLIMADQESAYTLTDSSTFMAFKGNLSLVPLIAEDEDLLNVYSAIAINPAKHPGVNCALANKFIDFLVSDEGQTLIANFGKEEHGEPLFFPAAGHCDVIGCQDDECATLTSGCPSQAAAA